MDINEEFIDYLIGKKIDHVILYNEENIFIKLDNGETLCICWHPRKLNLFVRKKGNAKIYLFSNAKRKP